MISITCLGKKVPVVKIDCRVTIAVAEPAKKKNFSVRRQAASRNSPSCMQASVIAVCTSKLSPLTANIVHTDFGLQTFSVVASNLLTHTPPSYTRAPFMIGCGVSRILIILFFNALDLVRYTCTFANL